MNFPIISIKTTSVCQLRCKNCFVTPWMEKNKNFHWSIPSVKRFINACTASGYHFKIVLLSGGEPLLWKNLIEAMTLIKEAGITDQIKMLTNSIAITSKNLEWLNDVLSLVDNMRISRYIGNEKSIELIEKYFGDRENVHISDKTEFVIQTDKPIMASLPADCACNYPTIFGDRVDICGGMRFLNLYHNLESDAGLTIPVRKGFLHRLSTKECNQKKYMQLACQYCMVNKNVLSVLTKEKNYCLKGSENEACND